MFLLNIKKVGGYRYKQRTWYGSYHKGVDYVADSDLVFAPENGVITFEGYGIQGGNWLYFLGDSGYLYKIAHLKTYLKKQGLRMRIGEIIAITGNTGLLTTGPHAHIEVWKNNIQYNPEIFFNNNKKKMIVIKKFGEDMIYVPVGNKLIKFETTWPIFALHFKNAIVVELSHNEFKKFIIVDNVSINNKLT